MRDPKAAAFGGRGFAYAAFFPGGCQRGYLLASLKVIRVHPAATSKGKKDEYNTFVVSRITNLVCSDHKMLYNYAFWLLLILE